MTPTFDSSLLNQQTKFNNRIKRTIEMKHKLAEINLLRVPQYLNNLNLFYDRIMNWSIYWKFSNIFYSSSIYKF